MTSSSIFSPDMNMNSQEDIIESIFQKRQQDFIKSEDLASIKANQMHFELSLGENSRNLFFKQKRLKQNINKNEITYELKDKLSIPFDYYSTCEKTIFNIKNFTQILSAFKSNSDIKQKFYGLVGLRKIIILPEAPIQEILNEGVIPDLIQLLDLNSNPEFQYEAILSLTFLITKTSLEISFLIIKQSVKKILKMIDSQIEEIKLQVGLFIGNLSGTSSKIRDLLINERIYDKIITTLVSTNDKRLIKNYTWALGNFFRIKPVMTYDSAKKSIKTVAKNLFFLQDDKDFLADACFILCFITENYKEGIKELLELEILGNIIKLLDCNVPYIQVTSLRLVGNIAAGNANQTQKLIDLGLLPYLKKTIFNQKKMIRKETAWILSNIAAGTQKQVEILIEQDFLEIFQNRIQNDLNDVQKECIWAMCNLTNVKNEILMKKILEQNILGCIKFCLLINETKNLAVNLEALNNLLQFGKEHKLNNVNIVAEEMERIGMLDILENLQSHPVEIVYEKTLKLLCDHFEVQFNE